MKKITYGIRQPTLTCGLPTPRTAGAPQEGKGGLAAPWSVSRNESRLAPLCLAVPRPTVVGAVAHAPAGAGQRRAPRRVALGRDAVDATVACCSPAFSLFHHPRFFSGRWPSVGYDGGG